MTFEEVLTVRFIADTGVGSFAGGDIVICPGSFSMNTLATAFEVPLSFITIMVLELMKPMLPEEPGAMTIPLYED